jgi:hypothetical protein
MNRKEKRKYQRETPARAKLQGKSFVETWFKEQKRLRELHEEQLLISYQQESISPILHEEWQTTMLPSMDSMMAMEQFHLVFDTGQRSCQTCKSVERPVFDFPCNTCSFLYELAFYASNKYKHYKHKNELCSFCAEELKRIKAGDTPCPLDTMEGLLL